MICVKGSINNSFSTDYHVAVSFNVVNMFPNIDNKTALESVKAVFFDNNFDLDSTQCIVHALEICLICNNSKFDHQHFLQNNISAQGFHMFCSYVDIAMAKFDSLANNFNLRPSVWKRFRGHVFVLWEHGIVSLPLFLENPNFLDKTGKTNLTMEVASNTGLEFLDLKLKIVEGKIGVDIFA